MIWLEVKFANILGAKLERFKVKKQSPYMAVCRCPYCGDSASNKSKTRGYIVEKIGKLFYFCQNCGKKTNFEKLLQYVDPMRYDDYVMEKLGESKPLDPRTKSEWVNDITKFATRRYEKFDPLSKLTKISSLRHDHPAKKYIMQRKIPSAQHFRLYYCSKFFAWVNELIPGKFDTRKLRDHPRLILPFIDRDGYMFGFQGRSFDKNDSMRYITIMLDDKQPKVFGVDQADFAKDTFVVEGPIDSLFLPNCIAMAGADVNINDVMVLDSRKAIFFYDNEPRNRQIVAKIEKRIDEGHRVVILPDSITQKDVNDIILSGIELEELSVIAFRNTYNGMMARLRLAEWNKL